MADYMTALRARLIADAGLSPLIGSRVFWDDVPQNTALPYVVLTTVSDPRPQHLRGYQTRSDTWVQADCLAATKAVAVQVAEAIVQATKQPGVTSGIRFGRIRADGPRSIPSASIPDGLIRGAQLDLIIEHRPA